MMLNFRMSGKKGDLITSLYIVKRLGGGNLYIDKGAFEEPLEGVIESCGKLIESQSYINSFTIYNGEKVDVELDLFRKNKFIYRKTMLEVMANSFGLNLEPNVAEWIEVDPKASFSDKIVIHHRKTSNGNRVNPLFKWEELFANFGFENFVFVSRLEDEWHQFGYSKLDYYCPVDNYEHAEIIKGARFFIGNLSFPASLADAVNANRIFELSVGNDRKSFAVEYSDRAWYYASPWNRTIYNFRYLKNHKNCQWFDIRTGSYINELPEEIFDKRLALKNEIKCQYKLVKDIFMRKIQSLLYV